MEKLIISRRTLLYLPSVLAFGGLAGCSKAATQAAPSSAAKGSSTVFEYRVGYPATNSSKMGDLVGLADTKGYLKEEFDKVNAAFKPVPFVKAGPAINSALASNSLEASNELGDVPALSAKAGGADTVLIGVSPAKARTDIVVPASSPVQSLADLRGKRIAVATGTYLQVVALKIIQDNGFSDGDFQFVNMAEVDSASAVAAGAVDAAVVTSFKGSKLKLDGHGRVIYTTLGNNEEAALAAQIVRADVAKEHPEVIVAFYKAVIRAQRDVEKDIAPLREQLVNTGLGADVVDDALPKASDYITTNQTSSADLQLFQKTADFLFERGLLKSKVDVDSWFDGSYYEKAVKELG